MSTIFRLVLRILTLVAALGSLDAAADPLASYDEVVAVLRDEGEIPLPTPAAARELAIYRLHRLPHYAMDRASVFGSGPELLEADAIRTVTSKVDYLDRLPKLLHPSGVCVAGVWETLPDTGFTGLLAGGRKSLFVGRISVAMQETTREHPRGFGFAGKLFPTTDPGLPVATENLFTVDTLLGEDTPRFLATATTNEPAIGFDASLLGLGARIFKALIAADKDPGFRPVCNLAAVGLSPGEEPIAPTWIQLRAAAGTARNDEPDFRNEVLKAQRDHGPLRFDALASNSSKDPDDTLAWTPLATILVSEAMVSYGCDRRLHFSHPKLVD